MCLVQYYKKGVLLQELTLTYPNLFDIWANCPIGTEWVCIFEEQKYRELHILELDSLIYANYPNVEKEYIDEPVYRQFALSK